MMFIDPRFKENRSRDHWLLIDPVWDGSRSWNLDTIYIPYTQA